MDPILEQHRRAYSKIIDMNRSVVSFKLYPTKADGFGGTIPDETQTPTIVVESVRFPHEQGSVPKNETGVVGLSTSFSLFVEMKHNSRIIEGSILSDGTLQYRVNKIDKLLVREGIYGKRAVVVIVGNASLIVPVLTGVADGPDAVVLDWPSLGVSTLCLIEKYNDSTMEYEQIASVSGITFDDTGLTAGTQYQYRARASYGGRYSDYSAEIFVATEGT